MDMQDGISNFHTIPSILKRKGDIVEIAGDMTVFPYDSVYFKAMERGQIQGISGVISIRFRLF